MSSPSDRIKTMRPHCRDRRLVMKTLFMTILLWVLLLLPAQAGDLHKAAAKGDIEKVKEFVTSHPEAINEMDSSGFQPLIYSCAKGSCEVTEYLISKGAGVNERAEGGLTPLHIAAYYKQKDIIKLLVSRGARIDAKENFGLTPMMSTDDMEIKKLLCSLDTGKDADPASLDNGYITWLASNWFIRDRLRNFFL
jgi:ankyrin repeat protein